MNPESLLRLIEENNQSVTSADFSNMVMTDDDFDRLFATLEYNNTIQSLSFLESGIREIHIHPLFKAMLKNKHITNFQIQRYSDFSPKALNLIATINQHVQDNAQNLNENRVNVAMQ